MVIDLDALIARVVERRRAHGPRARVLPFVIADMAQTPFYAPDHRPPARIPKAGEELFAFQTLTPPHHYRCELRHHGPYGVEAQFLQDGELLFAQTFRDVREGDQIRSARAIAIAWAEEERRRLQGQS